MHRREPKHDDVTDEAPTSIELGEKASRLPQLMDNTMRGLAQAKEDGRGVATELRDNDDGGRAAALHARGEGEGARLR